MCGTDLAYAGTELRYLLRRYSATSYANAVYGMPYLLRRCAVLTRRMGCRRRLRRRATRGSLRALCCYAYKGTRVGHTGIAYGAVLRCMCGTDLAYDATRLLVLDTIFYKARAMVDAMKPMFGINRMDVRYVRETARNRSAARLLRDAQYCPTLPCYALCGTDLRYAATRRVRFNAVIRRKDPATKGTDTRGIRPENHNEKKKHSGPQCAATRLLCDGSTALAYAATRVLRGPRY
eukprot:3941522-Rhodomonas_salina.7